MSSRDTKASGRGIAVGGNNEGSITVIYGGDGGFGYGRGSRKRPSMFVVAPIGVSALAFIFTYCWHYFVAFRGYTAPEILRALPALNPDWVQASFMDAVETSLLVLLITGTFSVALALWRRFR